jgi:hypothetical protein
MFQEYPKALYKGDSYRAVEDADQEAEARAQGWHDFGKASEAPQTGGASQSGDQAAAGQEQTAATATGRGKKAKADQAATGQEG